MKNDQSKTIFKTLKKYILKSGKSIEFISINTGLSVSQIKSIIDEKIFKIETLPFIKICSLLNVYLPDFE